MANFPDLNDDGKVTRADVLKGRGVFKKGGKVKKMRKFADGGYSEKSPEQRALDIGLKEGSPDYLKAVKTLSSGSGSGLDRMAEMFGGKPKSGLDKLRSDLKSTGRSAMSAGKTAVESMPVVRGAKELASRVKVPTSYDEEMGMKKGGKVKKMASGGKVSSASKRADGCAIRGKTKA